MTLHPIRIYRINGKRMALPGAPCCPSFPWEDGYGPNEINIGSPERALSGVVRRKVKRVIKKSRFT